VRCQRRLPARQQGGTERQWYEYRQAIDHFEGTLRDGKREGFGRDGWTPEVSYERQYANDVPNGFGTATLRGESFSGIWQYLRATWATDIPGCDGSSTIHRYSTSLKLQRPVTPGTGRPTSLVI